MSYQFFSARQCTAFVVLLASLFLFSFLPTVVDAASYTVSTTDDENDGSPSCVTGSSTDCSLREAIVTANANSGTDTITVPTGTYTLSVTGTSEDSSATGDLDLTDTSGTLTITGAGSGSTIINGGDIDRVIHTMSNTTVVFNDLTITNGSLGSSGIGMFSQGTTTLNNVIVSNNNGTGSFFGAGIRCQSGTMTITDSTITGNTGDSDHTGAGLSSNSCNLTITGSTFSNNTTGDTTGALFIGMGASNTAVIEDTMIIDNSSTLGGGIRGSTATTPNNAIELRNVTVSGNTADGAGGGIYTDTPMNLTNVTVIDNTGSTGGGMYVQNDAESTVVISHSTFIQNTANSFMSPTGGGLRVVGNLAHVSVNGSIFAANTAGTGPDCYAGVSGGLNSLTYSLVDDASGCNPDAETGNTNTGGSQYATVTLEDNGGVVETAAAGATDVTIDTVPAANCDDAEGDPLTEDARGMTRPQNTNCDMGAYEFDQTDPTVNITAGTDTVECVTGSWTNAGATVTDNFSSGLTASVTAGSVNANVVGTYPIVYTSTADVDGNTGTNTRTVTVSDTAVPTITITGESAITVEAGTTYTDLGATATDACDSTIAVNTASNVNTLVTGTYTVTYTASDDSSNNATAKERTVTVVDTTPDESDENDEGEEEEQEDDIEEEPSMVISTVTDADGSILVTYDDDATDTIQPYSSSKNFRYAVSLDRTRLVVTNGRNVKVYAAGALVEQKKLQDASQKKKNYRLFIKRLYSGYETVVVLSAQKQKGRMTVLRLRDDYALTKKTTKTMVIASTSTMTLKANNTSNQLTAVFGKEGSQQRFKWKLQKNGNLQLILTPVE